MPETTVMTNTAASPKNRKIRNTGRISQIWIYLGKFLRMFVYQNDWKVLPMSAIIAGLVAIVVRSMLFRNMIDTLEGAFALTCVAIWNGCFNSIQVICRERDVVKRDHRSGMHITSYVAAHLIYQAMLCLLQTGITVYVCNLAGVQFPDKGLFTPWMTVDFGISMFLISYASDVLSLWVSSLAHTTTAAMTIMPFIMIFQLVFSGGIFPLPSWSKPVSNLTVSRYGLIALASQSDYNSRPMTSAWSSIVRMWNTDISGTITVGQMLDLMSRDDISAIHELRKTEFVRQITVRELSVLIKESEKSDPSSEAAIDMLMLGLPVEYADTPISITFTLGEAVDLMASDPALESEREKPVDIHITVGEIIDAVGRDKVRLDIQQRATEASYNPTYEYSQKNVSSCWVSLILIAAVCAALTTVTLEFIDKDKR